MTLYCSTSEVSYAKEPKSIKPAEFTSLSLGKKSRWSKKNDIVLFKHLKTQIESTSLTFSDIQTSSGKKRLELNILLEALKVASNWNGTIINLHKRLIKIISVDGFTARDLRRLKKDLKRYSNGLITQECLEDNFPGRSLEQIMAYSKTSISRKKSK
jgi:hypothetical protein